MSKIPDPKYQVQNTGPKYRAESQKFQNKENFNPHMLVNIAGSPRIEYHGEGEADLQIDGTAEITGRTFSGAYTINLQEMKPPVLRAGEIIELGGGFDRFTGEFKISDLEVIEDY